MTDNADEPFSKWPPKLRVRVFGDLLELRERVDKWLDILGRIIADDTNQAN